MTMPSACHAHDNNHHRRHPLPAQRIRYPGSRQAEMLRPRTVITDACWTRVVVHLRPEQRMTDNCKAFGAVARRGRNRTEYGLMLQGSCQISYAIGHVAATVQLHGATKCRCSVTSPSPLPPSSSRSSLVQAEGCSGTDVQCTAGWLGRCVGWC